MNSDTDSEDDDPKNSRIRFKLVFTFIPSFWSLFYQDQEVGVSLFQVDEGIDTGPILVQKRMVNNFKTQHELIKHTKDLGITAILEFLTHPEIQPKTQSAVGGCYNVMPKRSDIKTFYKKGLKF